MKSTYEMWKILLKAPLFKLILSQGRDGEMHLFWGKIQLYILEKCCDRLARTISSETIEAKCKIGSSEIQKTEEPIVLWWNDHLSLLVVRISSHFNFLLLRPICLFCNYTFTVSSSPSKSEAFWVRLGNICDSGHHTSVRTSFL